jgi:hypothetical protein
MDEEDLSPSEFPPVGDQALKSSVRLFIDLSHLGIPHKSPEWVACTIVSAQGYIIDHSPFNDINWAWRTSFALQLSCHGTHGLSESVVSTKIKQFERLIKSLNEAEQKATEIDSHVAIKEAYASLSSDAEQYVHYLKAYGGEAQPKKGKCGLCAVATLWRSEEKERSWAYLKHSIAKVVKAMDLLEACYSALDGVKEAKPYWSIAMLDSLYASCHPLMELEKEKKLAACLAFAGDNIVNVRSLAYLDMYEQMKREMAFYGIKRPLEIPRISTERANAIEWLRRIRDKHSPDAVTMKAYGIGMGELNDALFDPSRADGLEEPDISGINTFVRTKLNAMEEEMINMEARLNDVLGQNREMVRLLRQLTLSMEPVKVMENPFDADAASDDSH